MMAKGKQGCRYGPASLLREDENGLRLAGGGAALAAALLFKFPHFDK